MLIAAAEATRRDSGSPSANAINDEDVGEEDEEESESEGRFCGVDWADTLDNCGDVVFAVCQDAHRIASVVDSGSRRTCCRQTSAAMPTPTDKSRAGIGFRGAGGDKIQNLGKREFRVKVSDGTVINST